MNDGLILVADGYCNSRIMKFNADGSHHSEYELPKKLPKGLSTQLGYPNNSSSSQLDGRGSGSSQLSVAHSLVVDECDEEVLLADRDNGRVLRFNLHNNKLIGGWLRGMVECKKHTTNAVGLSCYLILLLRLSSDCLQQIASIQAIHASRILYITSNIVQHFSAQHHFMTERSVACIEMLTSQPLC